MANFVGNAVSVEYAPLTYLTAGASLPSATLNVRDTTLLPATGTVTIGANTITYTGKTGTTLTGCTGGTGSVVAGDRVLGAFIAFTAYLKNPSTAAKFATVDVTHQNDTWKRILPGMGEMSLKMSILFEDLTFTTNPQYFLRSIQRRLVAWRLRERGAGTGFPEDTFDATLTSMSNAYNGANEVVAAEIELTVDGTPTYAAQA